MKKLSGIILALVLCLSLSVCAFAVESTPQVDDELIADIVDGVGDLVDAESEGDDEALEKAIENLYADLQVAQQTGDMSAIIDLVVKYALSEDADTSAVFSDLAAVEAVIEQFLVDGGYDVEAIKKELQSGSALNTLVGLYTGANEPTADAGNNNNTEVEENQPEVENPSTGDSSTGVAVALSALAVSAAAVIVLSKKED
ncbi:MAG: NPXTG-anchored protein [Clostridia bacterium]|nr:NPXTG-anchored protein [Clostridia bacterium]